MPCYVSFPYEINDALGAFMCRTYGARTHFADYPHFRLRVRSPLVWANVWSRLRRFDCGEAIED